MNVTAGDIPPPCGDARRGISLNWSWFTAGPLFLRCFGRCLLCIARRNSLERVQEWKNGSICFDTPIQKNLIAVDVLAIDSLVAAVVDGDSRSVQRHPGKETLGL